MSKLEQSCEVVVVGCVGTGKTSLISHRLMCQTEEEAGSARDVVELPAPAVTGGVSITESVMSFLHPPSQRPSKQSERQHINVRFREASGAMKSFWPGLVSRANVVIYVLDASAPWQIGNAVHQLTVSLTETMHKHFFIVLNKVDRCAANLPQTQINPIGDYSLSTLWDSEALVTSLSHPLAQTQLSPQEDDPQRSEPERKQGRTDFVPERMSSMGSADFELESVSVPQQSGSVTMAQLHNDLSLAFAPLERLAKSHAHALEFFKVSAVTGEGCGELYRRLAQVLLQSTTRR